MADAPADDDDAAQRREQERERQIRERIAQLTPDRRRELVHRSLVQRRIDGFDHFWTGRPWDEVTRRPAYLRLPVPRARPDELNPRQWRLGATEQVSRYWPYTDFTSDPERADERRRIEDKIVNRGGWGLVPALRPAGFTFKRLLGNGGMGIAALFERTEQDGTTITRIVVKSDLDQTKGFMLRERQNYIVSLSLK